MTFNGIGVDDRSGDSVSSAGDINGDGIDDLLIGAPQANPNGNGDAGETDLVYGKSGGAALSGTFDLTNADGIDDLLIGAHLADLNSNDSAGEVCLIYGRSGASALSGIFDLADADGLFIGADGLDIAGGSVSNAGDINGDGFDDLLIGAWGADPNGIDQAGETYLVYGQPIPESGTLELATSGALALFRRIRKKQ